MKNKIILFLATGLGLGYLPKAPGTFGSLLGVVLFYFLKNPLGPYFIVATALVSVAAIFISSAAEKIWQTKDDGRIVIDEVAGMMLTYVLFTPESTTLILGFIFFRFFDVLKLFPARFVQDKAPRGYGIVGDDLVAGLQAAGLLLVVEHYILK